MGYGPSKGKGGTTYAYFFGLGRHTKRTDCTLPYIEQGRLEDNVLRILERDVRISEEQVETGGKYAHKLLDEELAGSAQKAEDATKRLKHLERDKQISSMPTWRMRSLPKI